MPFVNGPSLVPLLQHGGAADDAAGPSQRMQQHSLRFSLRHRRGRAPFASLTAAAAQEAAAQTGLLLLPATTKRGGQLRQYAWDGGRLFPVNTELLGANGTPAARLLDHLSNLKRNLSAAFLPDPGDVTGDYWPWLKWRLAQRFCSAVVLNFATQSLLTAVGVGAQKALAASAAINWMLKDGISRVVRMSVATQWGDAFDSDLKRFRYGSSLVFSALLTCEFVAPFFPGSFLLLASISNVGRAVGLTTFVSTQPAFQQALCASGKMADLASKTQAQHMVMDTLALAVCSGANYLLRHQEARRRLLPVLAFPLFTLGDLLCIYQELKAVQLRTLNRERAEAVAQGWVESGQVPTFAAVSDREGLFFPPRPEGNLLPLRILPLERVARDPADLRRLMARHKRDAYMLAVRPPEALHPAAAALDRAWSGYQTVPHLAVALQEGATPQDVCTAVLHAAYLRKCARDALARRAPASNKRHGGGSSSGNVEGRAGASASPAAAPSSAAAAGPAFDVSQLSADELERCVEESGALARRGAKRFFADARAAGWATRRLLLSPTELAGYSLK